MEALKDETDAYLSSIATSDQTQEGEASPATPVSGCIQDDIDMEVVEVKSAQGDKEQQEVEVQVQKEDVSMQIFKYYIRLFSYILEPRGYSSLYSFPPQQRLQIQLPPILPTMTMVKRLMTLHCFDKILADMDAAKRRLEEERSKKTLVSSVLSGFLGASSSFASTLSIPAPAPQETEPLQGEPHESGNIGSTAPTHSISISSSSSSSSSNGVADSPSISLPADDRTNPSPMSKATEVPSSKSPARTPERTKEVQRKIKLAREEVLQLLLSIKSPHSYFYYCYYYYYYYYYYVYCYFYYKFITD